MMVIDKLNSKPLYRDRRSWKIGMTSPEGKEISPTKNKFIKQNHFRLKPGSSHV